MFKRFLPLLGFLILPSICLADTDGLSQEEAAQCSLMPSEATEVARSILVNGASYSEWCQVCGDERPGEVQYIESVSFQDRPDNYRAVFINGKRVDAAYIFVYHNRYFKNLGISLGCDTIGVTEGIFSWTHIMNETTRLNLEADRAALLARRAQ